MLTSKTQINAARLTRRGFLKLAPGTVSDTAAAAIRENIRQSGLYCSVIGAAANHIYPDPAKRKAVNG